MDSLREGFSNNENTGLYILSETMTVDHVEHLAQEFGFRVFHIDAEHISNGLDFIDKIAQIMEFPSYFGGSWDALLDCLSDLSWIESRGNVVLFSRVEGFAKNDPKSFDFAIEVLRHAVQRRIDTRQRRISSGKPFFVLFKGGEALVPGAPVLTIIGSGGDDSDE